MSKRRPFRPSLEILEDRWVPATITVTALDDSVAVPLPGMSLREAIAAANAQPNNDVIVFKKGLEGTIHLDTFFGEIDITSNLTIKGPGAGKIAVSGNFVSRIFNIDNGGGGADLTVKLIGLELRHGLASGGESGGALRCLENLTLSKMVFTLNQASQDGGAIFVDGDGNLTVVNTTITGNRAANGDGGGISSSVTGTTTFTRCTITGNTADNSGGGVHRNDGAATIIDCTITGNTAGGGGGFSSPGTVEITGSTITGNTATSGDGGGVGSSQVTISDSTISGNSATTTGGGIFCTTLNLSGSTIANNRAGVGLVFGGGGIHCGSATIESSTISGNTATDGGGGILSSGFGVSITGSTISGNRATNTGGGIDCPATVTIVNSSVIGNSGSTGGGIDAGTANLTRSTFAGNTASNRGGGVSCATATITACTLSGNTADFGGGIAFLASMTASEVRNSTISGNRATGSGGGVVSESDNLHLRNCTIAFNQAVIGGGLAVFSSMPFLESCLIADNIDDASSWNLANLGLGAFHLDHCLISVYDGAPVLDFAGDPISPASPGNNLFDVDAKLAPLANNGGPTQTHRLKKGSPAIDAGIVTTVAGLPNLTFDQRGAPFLRQLGADADMGAFERK